MTLDGAKRALLCAEDLKTCRYELQQKDSIITNKNKVIRLSNENEAISNALLDDTNKKLEKSKRRLLIRNIELLGASILSLYLVLRR